MTNALLKLPKCSTARSRIRKSRSQFLGPRTLAQFRRWLTKLSSTHGRGSALRERRHRPHTFRARTKLFRQHYTTLKTNRKNTVCTVEYVRFAPHSPREERAVTCVIDGHLRALRERVPGGAAAAPLWRHAVLVRHLALSRPRTFFKKARKRHTQY